MIFGFFFGNSSNDGKKMSCALYKSPDRILQSGPINYVRFPESEQGFSQIPHGDGCILNVGQPSYL
jgi:hypothetical protein